MQRSFGKNVAILARYLLKKSINIEEEESIVYLRKNIFQSVFLPEISGMLVFLTRRKSMELQKYQYTSFVCICPYVLYGSKVTCENICQKTKEIFVKYGKYSKISFQLYSMYPFTVKTQNILSLFLSVRTSSFLRVQSGRTNFFHDYISDSVLFPV
jgi:hypothetical protein